eukprot:CAMPEP_0170568016 /NCGR_PEP_ID=MMETSP0211-20121228/80862_1 /TAXON_ID=311385 /ORGANISM="Pseudokeronopsis sp., Strain OXSARD2" /LENGTH=101 /DNA_ID=CAMNT_0010889659 /DNA_START=463 /DNA_END=768 /DNA_ORIENTATION=-
MSAYDNIAVQYFYLGDLQKSKYYNERMVRGKSEAKFSVVRKISEANTVKKLKNNGVKPAQLKQLHQDHFGKHGRKEQTRSEHSIGREFKQLFSDVYKDYCL